MTYIPQSNTLSTKCLGKIFANTSATYKFFWFISILQIYMLKGCTRINVWDIVIRMVANAWYPIHYFRLSFGKNDSLFDIAIKLQELTGIPIDSSREYVVEELSKRINDTKVKSLLRTLTINVPYRFLRPWIDTSDDKEMVLRSQTLENGCLYKLERDEAGMWVELNSAWCMYLQEHYTILTDFAYWNLTLFLQVRNPNVPNIPNKLIKSEVRSALTNQRTFWNAVIHAGNSVRCIYTNKLLEVGDYDLDHFIPWSFVSHDLLWNLMPADSNINSSKSNRLPDLSLYLPKLAMAHQSALQTYLHLGKSGKVLEDYLSLGHTPQDIASMDKEHLLDCFSQTFTPMNQIALNMGFESWKYQSL